MKEYIYLSGSIEFSKNPYDWRNLFFKELNDHYNVIIPKYKNPPYEKSSPKYKKWVNDTFIKPDISDLLKSKYVFIKIDKAVLCGAGTISEVCFASFYKKNMVFILTDGLT